MEELINITNVEELRNQLNADPVDGDSDLDMKMNYLASIKTHPDYVILTHESNGNLYKLFYNISIDPNGNYSCKFSHMQLIQ